MLLRFCSFIAALLALTVASASSPAPLSVKEAARLAEYLDRHDSTPESYILEKLRRHDIVLLGEDHGIKHNLELAQRMIPLLHEAGVYNFGMEFGASEDQAALDALVTADRYDEDAARRLMFNYNVGWAFKEYLDIYRAAWRLNRSLPPGARPFRILNLSYKFDWSGYNGIRTPTNVARVFHKGNTERYRADLLRREILDRPGEKILVLTGTIHALTRYHQPVNDYLSDGFSRLEDRHMGNLLHQAAPGRVFFIALHRALDGQVGGPTQLVHPARGAIEQVMALRPGKRFGFDLAGSPLGELPDDSYQAIGHPQFRLGQYADGYIFEKPFSEFDGCTIDEKFLSQDNWLEAQRQYPDPDMNPRPQSLEEYRRRIRAFADIPSRYRRVHITSATAGSGRIDTLAPIASKFVAQRRVDVWLPPHYDAHPGERYPVLYMHDGQNVFDPATSYGGVSWEVDEAMRRLIEGGKTRGAIIVGIWNTGETRFAEYMPQKAVTTPQVKAGADRSAVPTTTLRSDAYLKFLVEELKPLIDRTYRTRPEAAHTFVMGSSMGGLISAYAVAEYPQVFGAAACISTHWPAGEGAVIDYLARHLPASRSHRFYFDYGTVTLDASYEPYQQRMDAVMRSAGYSQGSNWLTRKFPGAEHSERAWRERVETPLAFLLGVDPGTEGR